MAIDPLTGNEVPLWATALDRAPGKHHVYQKSIVSIEHLSYPALVGKMIERGLDSLPGYADTIDRQVDWSSLVITVEPDPKFPNHHTLMVVAATKEKN